MHRSYLLLMRHRSDPLLKKHHRNLLPMLVHKDSIIANDLCGVYMACYKTVLEIGNDLCGVYMACYKTVLEIGLCPDIHM